jgi:DNA-directed RNA polymerase specialized sigma24 family protein
LDAVVETAAKYFYFSSLSEQSSFAASLKALTDLKHNGWLGSEHKSKWIQVLSKWKPRLRGLRSKAWIASAKEAGFILPPDLDINVWMSFLGNGEPTEVEAVLLSKILGFSDDEIAEGLGVTAGTVRYRIGRGLRHLGGYLES